VEIVKRALGAFNRRDVDAYDAFTPDFELLPAMVAGLDGKTYRGREGYEQFLAEYGEVWETLVVVPEEYRDLGDRVLALGRMTGSGRGGGVPVDAPWGGVYDFRDGKVSRPPTFLDHGEALRVAGLPE
jgi:ketosteroid isomerase-like protein